MRKVETVAPTSRKSMSTQHYLFYYQDRDHQMFVICSPRRVINHQHLDVCCVTAEALLKWRVIRGVIQWGYKNAHPCFNKADTARTTRRIVEAFLTGIAELCEDSGHKQNHEKSKQSRSIEFHDDQQSWVLGECRRKEYERICCWVETWGSNVLNMYAAEPNKLKFKI